MMYVPHTCMYAYKYIDLYIENEEEWLHFVNQFIFKFVSLGVDDFGGGNC